MKMTNRVGSTHWSGKLLIAGLAIGLSSGMAFAQTAGQDMKDAGHETKDAANDAGHATKRTTKTAYHKTKRGTKTAYHKTADVTKTAGHDTKEAAKETGHRTENAGDAIAGKPEQH